MGLGRDHSWIMDVGHSGLIYDAGRLETAWVETVDSVVSVRKAWRRLHKNTTSMSIGPSACERMSCFCGVVAWEVMSKD